MKIHIILITILLVSSFDIKRSKINQTITNRIKNEIKQYDILHKIENKN
jgi:hypothetical protein